MAAGVAGAASGAGAAGAAGGAAARLSSGKRAAGTAGVNVETTGAYVVTYRAMNAGGLWSDSRNAAGTAAAAVGCRNGAARYYRTVVVKDSLQPVLEIRYRNKVVARSKGAPSVHGTWSPQTFPANPAANHWTDAIVNQDSTPGAQYLVEVAARGSRGWAVAAVCAAAAGVALLGLSARRRVLTTPVPV